MLNWDEQYSVGVKELDDQHKSMVDYINQIEKARTEGDDRTTVVKILNGLVLYTKDHFALEETYFKMFDYAKIDVHIQEHLSLIEQVEKLVYHFEIGKPPGLTEMMDFLKTWLIDHILGADKEYMQCFSENGLS